MLDNREKIEQLENEVKEKQQEIEYCTSQSRLDILEEEVYNTKHSIKELRKNVGS
jgi:wobble nucleotide-excising tRNase|tara:strand:- start:1054 stop:1218 length:165 start_codon:yes stop_codon:yes gene_type:complete